MGAMATEARKTKAETIAETMAETMAEMMAEMTVETMAGMTVLRKNTKKSRT